MSEENQLNVIIQELSNIANRDGLITDEEKEIISQVEFDSNFYELMLSDALEDGIITDEENEKLHDISQSMLQRAEIIANIDGKLSEDEKALIEKLTEIIKTKHEH